MERHRGKHGRVKTGDTHRPDRKKHNPVQKRNDFLSRVLREGRAERRGNTRKVNSHKTKTLPMSCAPRMRKKKGGEKEGKVPNKVWKERLWLRGPPRQNMGLNRLEKVRKNGGEAECTKKIVG